MLEWGLGGRAKCLCEQTGTMGGKMQTVQKVGVGGDLDAAATQLKRDELSLFDSRRQDRHLSERPYGSFWNEAIGLANKLCH